MNSLEHDTNVYYRKLDDSFNDYQDDLNAAVERVLDGYADEILIELFYDRCTNDELELDWVFDSDFITCLRSVYCDRAAEIIIDANIKRF